jgi:Dolichyl-phosphate-mannose-protein mannosyltransferase
VRFRIQSVASSPWVIFSAALCLRLAFLFQQAHLVPDQALAVVPFQNEVGGVAAALAKGEGFCCLFQQDTGPTAWVAPVYPFFLAGIFKVFGVFSVASFYAAALFNCIFSALICLPLYSTARSVGGPVTAAAAGWLWVFFPSGILIPFEWIWDTSLSALLATSLLWFTIVFAEQPRRRDFILYGLFWGFCLLVNPALGAVLPIFLLWIFLQTREKKVETTRGLMLVIAMTVLVCLPWTIRNSVTFHRLVPIRSDFPFELWMGNNPIYDEHSHAVNRITRYEQVHLYTQLGETAFLREKGREAREFIRSHPALCLRLAWERAVALWLGTSSPWQDFLRTDALLVRIVFIWNALTLLGTILGIACLARARRSYVLVLAAFPVAFPLVYYVTQVSLRLRHPCDPALALLMAVGLTFPWVFRRAANQD